VLGANVLDAQPAKLGFRPEPGEHGQRDEPHQLRVELFGRS
jgi:hypothetical protein